MGLKVGGYNKVVDWIKLGPSLLIATCFIVGIRTVKWAANQRGTQSWPDLDKEVDFAVDIATAVMARLVSKKAQLFAMKDVPWYVADDEDAPK